MDEIDIEMDRILTDKGIKEANEVHEKFERLCSDEEETAPGQSSPVFDGKWVKVGLIVVTLTMVILFIALGATSGGHHVIPHLSGWTK